MPPAFRGMMGSMGLGTELIYAFVIIAICLMIYFGTRELYKLSSHKGIKYFREAFLFLALAFFFRSFVKITFLMVSNPKIIQQSLQLFEPITTLLFIYFITMAIFFLVYSMFWKRLEKFPSTIFLLHTIAGIVALVIIFTKIPWLYLTINVVLLLIVLFAIYSLHNDKKEKKNNLKIIYTLLSAFLFLNVIDILIPNALQLFQIFIYLISIGIFLWILYKVLKKIGPK